MDCAKHQTGDDKERESREVSDGTTGDRQWTGRRKRSEQSEARKQKVDNNAKGVNDAQGHSQRKRMNFPGARV